MTAPRPIVLNARNLAVLLLGGASLAACATATPEYAVRNGAGSKVTGHGQHPSGAGGVYKVGAPYQVGGIWYVPREQPNYDETGTASWYGDEFHMKPTANGETFDMGAVSAAHTTLPLPSIVEVTNLDNGKSIKVRVNDRGPFVGGRVIDLSREAARQLDYDRKGTAQVRVRYVGPAPLNGMPAAPQYATNTAPHAATPSNRPLIVTPSTPPDEAPRGYTPPPVKVAATALPPLAPAATAPVAVASGIYKVQAGAFGDHANAQKAVSQLAGAGAAVIEPVDRDGVTLYRVMIQASADETQAWALRDQVAAYGFSDARVIRPF